MIKHKQHPAILRMRPKPVWNTRSKPQLAKLKRRLCAIGKPSMSRMLQTDLLSCIMGNFIGRMYHNHIGKGIIRYIKNWGWCQEWVGVNMPALYKQNRTYIPEYRISFKHRWHSKPQLQIK